MTPLLGVLFIPYRTSIIHPTLWLWTRKHLHRRLTRAEAQRDRAVASIECDQILPLANSAKAPPCPSLPASAGLVLRSHRKGSNVVRSVPFRVNRWDRPPCDSSGAVSGRSEPWRRTPQPPRAKRESSSVSEPSCASAGLVLRSHRNDSGRVKSVPFCVNRRD